MLLFLLSEESVSVQVERVSVLVLKLRPVPGAVSARARLERALSIRASAVALSRLEKTALLDGLNAWADQAGFDTLGPDLIDLRGALEYDLGVAEGTAS